LGAMSAALKKKLDLTITSEKAEGLGGSTACRATDTAAQAGFNAAVPHGSAALSCSCELW
jgi:hypothetical protein